MPRFGIQELRQSKNKNVGEGVSEVRHALAFYSGDNGAGVRSELSLTTEYPQDKSKTLEEN